MNEENKAWINAQMNREGRAKRIERKVIAILQTGNDPSLQFLEMMSLFEDHRNYLCEGDFIQFIIAAYEAGRKVG